MDHTHRTRRGPGEIEDEGTRTQTSRNSGRTNPIHLEDHELRPRAHAEEDARRPAGGKGAKRGVEVEELRPAAASMQKRRTPLRKRGI